MATALVDWQAMRRVGLAIVGRAHGGRHMARARGEYEFRSIFGCSPEVATDAWHRCTFTNPKTQIKHFLWGLMFMNVYSSEQSLAKIASCHAKTFRKWTWPCIFDLSDVLPSVVSYFVQLNLIS